LARRVVIANPRSGAEIDEIALRIIQKFQPKVLDKPTPFEIELFFECSLESISGVNSDYKELPSGIYGYTDSDAMESVISSELMDDPFQIRFCRSTMAHEVGHVLIHVPEFRCKKALLRSIHDKRHVSLRLYREVDVPVFKNPEWQAWRFAGALLMPAPTFISAVKDGLDERELSRLFQVNPAFVRTRLSALKIKYPK
jgi:Zn-dependent peptidase ImmA (M78 family)